MDEGDRSSELRRLPLQTDITLEFINHLQSGYKKQYEEIAHVLFWRQRKEVQAFINSSLPVARTIFSEFNSLYYINN